MDTTIQTETNYKYTPIDHKPGGKNKHQIYHVERDDTNMIHVLKECRIKYVKILLVTNY